MNVSLEQRFHELEHHNAEATTLLHLQGTLILDLQVNTYVIGKKTQNLCALGVFLYSFTVFLFRTKSII